MIISGFQPLSLLDYPGIICSIVFTQGCPFRCGYCHNPELIPTEPSNTRAPIPEETILEHLRRRKHVVEGVCITGGEPTVHPDLPAFIRKLKHLGMLVKLDTNGVHPRMVETIVKERLVDFIAMDLKHVWEQYPKVIGIDQTRVIDNCRETFDLIQTSPIAHEFRTTVYPGFHSEEDLLTIAKQLSEGATYALQDIRYKTTLAQDLIQMPALDLHKIAERIGEACPRIHVDVRNTSL